MVNLVAVAAFVLGLGITLGILIERTRPPAPWRDQIVLTPHGGDETDRIQAALDFTVKYGGDIRMPPGQ